jgi:hypothetical protein
MRKMIRGRLTAANGLGVVAVFLALGGGAYAASSSSLTGAGGAITSCVGKKGGTLKVTKPGQRCPKGKVKLTFNAAGPIGPAGATGPTGPTGLPVASATTVDGETVTKISLREPTPSSSMAETAIVNTDGLTIDADCDNGGNASLVANGPASNDAELTYSGWDDAPTYFGGEVHNLGSASTESLGPPDGGEVAFTYENTSGQVVSGNIGYQKAPSFGAFNGCSFFGAVTSG